MAPVAAGARAVRRIDVDDIEVTAHRTYNVAFERVLDGHHERAVDNVCFLDENGEHKPIGVLPAAEASALRTAIGHWCEEHPLNPHDVYDDSDEEREPDPDRRHDDIDFDRDRE